MQKYRKIQRLGAGGTENVFSPGDEIVVQEKLDGANASFKRDQGQILAFSRNTELHPRQDLRGFYGWTRTLNVDNVREGKIYFGEWLVKHQIDYGEHMNKFYLFDIYDTKKREYAPFAEVEAEAARLNLNMVPVFYEGKYESPEQLNAFVGKSDLCEAGEGVVVKNTTDRDKYGQQKIVKIVSSCFLETKTVGPTKKKNKKKKKKSAEETVAQTTVTQARVAKLFHKLIDEQVVSSDVDMSKISMVSKELNMRVYEDVVSEEPELVATCDPTKLQKSMNKIVTRFAGVVLRQRK